MSTAAPVVPSSPAVAAQQHVLARQLFELKELRQSLGGKAGRPVALIMIQGASSPPSGYRDVLLAVQHASELPLWVGVPEFLKDTPQPLQMGSKLVSTLGRPPRTV